jgi:hypothetical protein
LIPTPNSDSLFISQVTAFTGFPITAAAAPVATISPVLQKTIPVENISTSFSGKDLVPGRIILLTDWPSYVGKRP